MEEGAKQHCRPNSRGFFKIILQETIENEKLVLPKSFIKKHGKNLCNHNFVYLEVPTGDLWKVWLQISHDGISLENGWKEFAEFYHVELGHFLTFRYEFESNKLQVVIYNKSTTEIDYPMRPPIKREVEDDDDDASPVIKSSTSLSGFWSSKKRLKICNQEASPSNIGVAEASASTPHRCTEEEQKETTSEGKVKKYSSLWTYYSLYKSRP